MGFKNTFFQMLKDFLRPKFLKLVHKIECEKNTPNSFDKMTITLVRKTRQLHKNNREDYQPISLINTDVKLKQNIHKLNSRSHWEDHYQIDFFQGSKVGSTKQHM